MYGEQEAVLSSAAHRPRTRPQRSVIASIVCRLVKVTVKIVSRRWRLWWLRVIGVVKFRLRGEEGIVIV
jgi:hypothetical protein